MRWRGAGGEEAVVKKVLLYVVAGLLVVVVLVLAVGALLPPDHVAARSAEYNQPPAAIWEAVTDYESFPEWRSGVSTVDRLADRDGRPVWVENGSFGPLPMATDESRPPTRLVLRIADDNLPFGGTWTYEIERSNGAPGSRSRSAARSRTSSFASCLASCSGTPRRWKPI